MSNIHIVIATTKLLFLQKNAVKNYSESSL